MGIRRGEIYFVDFGPVRYDLGTDSNKEPALNHPVVVLSINSLNLLADRPKNIMLVCVVPGTSNLSGGDYPTVVRVPSSASGLPKETVFRAFQLTSIDSRRFTGSPAGYLPNDYVEKI